MEADRWMMVDAGRLVLVALVLPPVVDAVGIEAVAADDTVVAREMARI